MARILLIDDDDSVRTLMGLLLVRSGHTVIEARDGLEGLELFPGTAADLVITDITMPRRNGLEVVRVLREKQPPVKVIAMSGGVRFTADNPLDTARRLGAARVLAKPFSIEALMAAINEVLTGRAADTIGG
jgi:CheY-like chemotaxis protein